MHKSSHNGRRAADGKESDALADAAASLPPLPLRAGGSGSGTMLDKVKRGGAGAGDKSKARERNLR